MCFRPPAFGEMMKTCPSCGAFNDPANVKCKKCGEVLPEEVADPANMPAIGAPKGPAGPGAPKGPAGPGGAGAPVPPRGPASPPAPKGPANPPQA